MSALLRASLKRKRQPIEYADETEPTCQSNPGPVPAATSMPLPAPVVNEGFRLMNNFLNDSLSSNTKKEYQVCS